MGKNRCTYNTFFVSRCLSRFMPWNDFHCLLTTSISVFLFGSTIVICCCCCCVCGFLSNESLHSDNFVWSLLFVCLFKPFIDWYIHFACLISANGKIRIIYWRLLLATYIIRLCTRGSEHRKWRLFQMTIPIVQNILGCGKIVGVLKPFENNLTFDCCYWLYCSDL